MSMVNINGVNLEFDLFDADVMEVFETNVEITSNSLGNMEKYNGMSAGEAFRMQCEGIDHFFDEVFGEGTAEALFGGKNNIKDHIEAFSIICKQAESMKEELEAMKEEYGLNKKYNREQRRYAQFHGQKGNNGKS